MCCERGALVLAAFADFFELLNALHNGSAVDSKEQQSLQGIALDHYQYLHYRRAPPLRSTTSAHECACVRAKQSACCCALLV